MVGWPVCLVRGGRRAGTRHGALPALSALGRLSVSAALRRPDDVSVTEAGFVLLVCAEFVRKLALPLLLMVGERLD